MTWPTDSHIAEGQQKCPEGNSGSEASAPQGSGQEADLTREDGNVLTWD